MNIELKRKEQWMKASKEEEDRIREMKKSHDYHKWAGLSYEIDKKFWELAELTKSKRQLLWLSSEVDKKFSEMVDLKEKERLLEDKLLKVYDIKIHTKYGLFRSRRYNKII